MKKLKIMSSKTVLVFGLISLVIAGCQRELSDDVVEALYPSTAEIFTDTPVGIGTNFYFPYRPEPTNPVGSKFTAWSTDQKVSYQGSAPMRIDVPIATSSKFAISPISPAGFHNGSELEIRTYIHINIGK
jgi:hypothetical protein